MAPAEEKLGEMGTQYQELFDEIGYSEGEGQAYIDAVNEECLKIYQAQLKLLMRERVAKTQEVADAEAEMMGICVKLGEKFQPMPREGSLRAQLSNLQPVLKHLQERRRQRVEEFAEVDAHILKLTAELQGKSGGSEDISTGAAGLDQSDESRFPDLTAEKLEELQIKRNVLLKEKSERLERVMALLRQALGLCTVLSLDFGAQVERVHPSLVEAADGAAASGGGQPRSLTFETIHGLEELVGNLSTEKHTRAEKLASLSASLLDLWKLLEIPPEEQMHHLAETAGVAVEDVVQPGALSMAVIEEAQEELLRLEVEKASKMKELVERARLELEEVCVRGHMMVPEALQMPSAEMIESGLVDLSALLSMIEEYIVVAKEELSARKEILKEIDRWMAAQDEAVWLEEYNRDELRFSNTRGQHVNLKRAEKARATVAKMPTMVDALEVKVKAWEEECGAEFYYDGIRVIERTSEYRAEWMRRKDEEKVLREEKKMMDKLAMENELRFGTKVRDSPRKTAAARTPVGAGRRLSLGGAQLSGTTPRGSAAKKPSPVPPNFVALSKNGATPEERARMGLGSMSISRMSRDDSDWAQGRSPLASFSHYSAFNSSLEAHPTPPIMEDSWKGGHLMSPSLNTPNSENAHPKLDAVKVELSFDGRSSHEAVTLDDHQSVQ